MYPVEIDVGHELFLCGLYSSVETNEIRVVLEWSFYSSVETNKITVVLVGSIAFFSHKAGGEKSEVAGSPISAGGDMPS